jgi:hypothetical protein
MDSLVGKYIYYKMDESGREFYRDRIWEGFTKVNGIGDPKKGPCIIIIDVESEQSSNGFVHLNEHEVIYVFDEGNLIELISE